MAKELYTGRGILIPDQHVALIDRKPFIKFPGLVKIAHDTAEQMEGRLTQTAYEIVQLPSKDNSNTAVILVEVAVQDKNSDRMLCKFHGIGDASPASVGARISPHIIRMAETRAVARALRVLTDVGMTALEELDGGAPAADYTPPAQNSTAQNTQAPEKTQERVNLENQIKKIKKDKGFSAASMLKAISLQVGRNVAKVREVSNEELQKVVDHFSETKVIEQPKHTEAPPSQKTVENKPSAREDLMKKIKSTSAEAKLSSAMVKKIAIELFDKPDDFKSADLTEEQLTELITAMEKRI